MTDRIFERVLALEVRSLSFGFALFETPTDLVDWGVRSFRNGVNAVKISMGERISRLIIQFKPDVLVVNVPLVKEQAAPVSEIRKLARTQGIRFRMFSRNEMRGTLQEHSRNKYQVAIAIAERFPELTALLPAKRKIWQAEHYRMKIFDAAALALAYLAREKVRDERESFRRPLIDA
jgi:hypothetical protein